MSSLDTVPITRLKGVGDKIAQKLGKLAITSLADLVLHLPYRYEDRTQIITIDQLTPAIHTTIEADVVNSQITQGRRRMLNVTLTDGHGTLVLRFFHFSAAQQESFKIGTRVRAFGEIKSSLHQFEIIHPEYQILTPSYYPAMPDRLTPVYATTEGLKQQALRKLVAQALDQLNPETLAEYLPTHLLPNQLSLIQAIQFLHQPTAGTNLQQLELGQHPAQQRLSIEELLAHSLSMLQLRATQKQYHARAIAAQNMLEQQFLVQLPFQPTAAQQRVLTEIKQDLSSATPMMRLVQGDVGSGKTLVAALSALNTIAAGYQVVLMAPTEILAEQHTLTFQNWFESLGIEVAWLAGKLKGKARQQALEKISSGTAKMIVGTHALFQDEVTFHDLNLIIVDEQHRFGVHQRLQMREKGRHQGHDPHQLIMTATPIPRTLAMTAYADLDTSVIDELPPGRTPITTVAIPDNRRDEIIERVRLACLAGRQVYWVCTLIDESEVLECEAAEKTAEMLAEQLAELKIGLVHGRMKSDEKQKIMTQFKSGECDLLVATTVIEVGVDVPNASLMIIENPERLGLAQLHQLRGRVGRGTVASHCVLLYHAPLSQTAQARIGVLRQSNDGFVIAQRDLEIRGPGEVLGTKQTGLADLKVADLIRDADLLPQVQRLAQHLHQQYPLNAQNIIHRWLHGKDIYRQA